MKTTTGRHNQECFSAHGRSASQLIYFKKYYCSSHLIECVWLWSVALAKKKVTKYENMPNLRHHLKHCQLIFFQLAPATSSQVGKQLATRQMTGHFPKAPSKKQTSNIYLLSPCFIRQVNI